MGPINGGPMNFSFTRLRHASLRFATLTGANLEMADLSAADLSDARLDGANLSGADLSEALCERADFANARLGGANLAAANLKDARNLTQSQIDEALGDALTVLPAHLARPAGWGGGGSQVMSGLLARNGNHRGDGKPATPTRGDTVSWLVGGPRRSDGRSAVPQAEPA
jgi:pentapeptide repeat protein